jgi:hypothetical protein
LFCGATLQIAEVVNSNSILLILKIFCVLLFLSKLRSTSAIKFFTWRNVSGDNNDNTLDMVATSELKDLQLSAALNEQIKSPNRLFATQTTYATLAVGFPECVRKLNTFSLVFSKRKAIS